MKVNLNLFGDFKNDEQELRAYVCEKSSAFLKSSKKHIKEIVVNIFNTDDRQKYADKRCSIHLFIPGQYPIKVTKQDDNIFMAITKAVEAAAYKTSIRTKQRVILTNN